jgi:hypothetical protein
MKFLKSILIFSSLIVHWAYPCGALGIPESFLKLYSHYSMLHNLLSRNIVPNIYSSILEIPVANDEKCDLLASLPKHSCSLKEDIQYACEHDHYLQLLSISEHFLNYIFAQSNLDTFVEQRLSKHLILIWLPKLYVPSTDLLHVCFFDTPSYCKSIKFIETYVPAIDCRV